MIIENENGVVQPDEDENNKQERARTARNKIERNLAKYMILPPCTNKCEKKCTEWLVTENNHIREGINKRFWSLDFATRRQWLDGHIKATDVKRRTKNVVLDNKEKL